MPGQSDLVLEQAWCSRKDRRDRQSWDTSRFSQTRSEKSRSEHESAEKWSERSLLQIQSSEGFGWGEAVPLWGCLARIAQSSAPRRRAERARDLVLGAVRTRGLWHVHSLADKWIPLFTQPGIAFGSDLAKHSVSSASLSTGGPHPALPVKQVLCPVPARSALKAQRLRSKQRHPLPRPPEAAGCPPASPSTRAATWAGRQHPPAPTAEMERGGGARLRGRGTKAAPRWQ